MRRYFFKKKNKKKKNLSFLVLKSVTSLLQELDFADVCERKIQKRRGP